MMAYCSSIFNRELNNHFPRKNKRKRKELKKICGKENIISNLKYIIKRERFAEYI